MPHWFHAISAALALSVAPLGAATRTPTIDECLSLKSVARPRISPDGRHVVYEVSQADWKENAYVTHLWLADTQTSRTFQLTRGKKSSDNAQWSPDGRWLAFLTERESGAVQPLALAAEKKEGVKDAEAKPDGRQIWLISPLGGEAWLLTKHGAKIDRFRWSDDSRQIAFAAPAPETKTAKERKDKYSDYEVVEEDYDQSQLWVVDVVAAEKSGLPTQAVQITSDPKVHVGEFAWSPDGSKLAFTGTSSPLLSFGGSADIYLADLGPGTRVHKIVGLEGPDTTPRFSPDGTRLAFTTSLAQPRYYYMNRHIAVVVLDAVLKHPATKPSEIAVVTQAFDEDAALLEWSPAGILFRALQRTNSHLFRIDPGSRKLERLTPADPFFLGEASFTLDYSAFAFTAQDAKRVTEVHVAALPRPGVPFADRRLTDMTAQLAGYTLGTVEMVSWKSTDGTEIEGVLHKPADFDPAKKYPLLLLIHGGPTGISRPVATPSDRRYPVQAFLAKGALILEPNYRGSAGYGEKFRSLNARNLGVGDMWDVMSGVDALIAKGIVDPDRLGAMGWSQGGYISAFLTTNTHRFKAISAGAGISDWMTYYVNTDITPFTRQYLDATPWEDPEIYAKTSPITNIRNAKTPTLIQTGDRDKRVPPPNSFQLYRGLRDVGVPTRLILYTGFGHGITKPKSNRAVLQHNLDWFSHYVFGEPIPKESPLRGTGFAD